MPNNLSDWLTYFENLHPVGIDLGLTRVSAVWDNICKQENIKQLAKEKVITVAGTNGKGSACKMLSLLLSTKEKRVGTYTSPHIHHFRERVQINGSAVDDEKLILAFSTIERARGDISISYFEATTLVGLLVFAWEQVDFAILEVGLGGRLDAINIIDANAVIITSIGKDHEAYLGNNLSQIALEKAGVCRSDAPCIYAQENIYDNVINFARQERIPLYVNGRDYTIKDDKLLLNEEVYQIPKAISALGAHQVSNCAAVLVLLKTLNLLPTNYAQTLTLFALPGRLEKIARYPDIIVDVAHNEDSASALADYLSTQQPHYKKIYAVIGMLADKNHRKILAAIANQFDAVYLGSTKGDRSFRDIDLLPIAIEVLPCPIYACGELENALEQAQKQAEEEDLIVAFGSFLVAEALT